MSLQSCGHKLLHEYINVAILHIQDIVIRYLECRDGLERQWLYIDILYLHFMM